MKKIALILLVVCAAVCFAGQYTHAVQGLVPVADAFAGTKYTDIVNFKNANEIHFYIFKGAGDTGTSVITVEACDDTGATTTSAVTFRMQKNTTSDTFGNDSSLTTAGFTTTAGANQIYKIVVRKNDVISTGYSYVRLKMVEDTNHPVTGCVLIVIPKLRYDRPVQPSSFLN